MSVKVSNLAIDCTDLDGTVRFWSTLLGLKVVRTDDDWVDLEPLGAGGPLLSFQQVPEGKESRKNRIHLDVEVDDLDSAEALAAELGARRAPDVHDDPEASFRVWRDPEGNEFCLVRA